MLAEDAVDGQVDVRITVPTGASPGRTNNLKSQRRWWKHERYLLPPLLFAWLGELLLRCGIAAAAVGNKTGRLVWLPANTYVGLR